MKEEEITPPPLCGVVSAKTLGWFSACLDPFKGFKVFNSRDLCVLLLVELLTII